MAEQDPGEGMVCERPHGLAPDVIRLIADFNEWHGALEEMVEALGYSVNSSRRAAEACTHLGQARQHCEEVVAYLSDAQDSLWGSGSCRLQAAQQVT